jgi:hypothetical protein
MWTGLQKHLQISAPVVLAEQDLVIVIACTPQPFLMDIFRNFLSQKSTACQ